MCKNCYVPKYDRGTTLTELTGDLRSNAFPDIERDRLATEMGISSRRTLYRYEEEAPRWQYLTFLARIIGERAEAEGCNPGEVKECQGRLLSLLSSVRRHHCDRYSKEKEPTDWNSVIQNANRFEPRDRKTLLECLGRRLDNNNSVRLDQLRLPKNAILLDTTREAYSQVQQLVEHQITELDPNRDRLPNPLKVTGDLYKQCCLELLRKHEGSIATDTKIDSPFWVSEYSGDLKRGNVEALERLGATHNKQLVRRFIQLECSASDYLTDLSDRLSRRKKNKRLDEIQLDKAAFFRLKRNMDELIGKGCAVRAGRGAWETSEGYFLKRAVPEHGREAEMLLWGKSRIQFFITASGIVTHVFDYSAAVDEFEEKRALSEAFYERQWNDDHVMDGSEFLKKVQEIYDRY